MQMISPIVNANHQGLSTLTLSGPGHSFFKPFIQPKLSVNQPNDIYEQEADVVADKVMKMSGDETMQHPFFKPIPSIQRKCAHCEEEEKQMQRKENSNKAPAISAQTENYVNSISGGTGLNEKERSFFEARMSHDFSGVRLHTDADASLSAKTINARAYTIGNNIVFNEGEYAPGTESGKRLLAHELTHVVQQGEGKAFRTIQRTANFIQGQENPVINLAEILINPRLTFGGLTLPVLNGKEIFDIKEAKNAIQPPVLNHSNANGTTEAWVDTVPANDASFSMYLPASPPWSITTPAQNIVHFFTSLQKMYPITIPPQCIGSGGDALMNINGKPTDVDLAANIRKHEHLHAADHQAGFNSVIVPWDKQLQAAQGANTKFKGASEAKADAALFAAMGGTPEQVAKKQVAEWDRLSDLLHKGNKILDWFNLTANGDCSVASVDLQKS